MVLLQTFDRGVSGTEKAPAAIRTLPVYEKRPELTGKRRGSTGIIFLSGYR
jgi:hypothetical protein